MITTPDSENSNMSNTELETASYSHTDPFGSGGPNGGPPGGPSESPQPPGAGPPDQLSNPSMGPPGGASRPSYPSDQDPQEWQSSGPYQPPPGNGSGPYYPAYSQGYSGYTPSGAASAGGYHYNGGSAGGYTPPGYQPAGYPPQYPHHQTHHPHPGSHPGDQYGSYYGSGGQHPPMGGHQQYYGSSSGSGGGGCTPSPHAGSDDSSGDAVNEVKHHPYFHQKGLHAGYDGYAGQGGGPMGMAGGHLGSPGLHSGGVIPPGGMPPGGPDPHTYKPSTMGPHSITTSVLKRPRSSLLPASKRSKKSSRHRDPNEPQKPVSAYALFFRDTQAAIKARNPAATFGEVSKHVAAMWDNLDPDAKAAYKKRTETAKKEYLKRLAAYRASLISKGGSGSDMYTIGAAPRTSPGGNGVPGAGGSSGFSYPTPGGARGAGLGSGGGPLPPGAGGSSVTGASNGGGLTTLPPKSHSPAGSDSDHLTSASAMNEQMNKNRNNNTSSYSPLGIPRSNGDPMSENGSPYHPHQQHSPAQYHHHNPYQSEMSSGGPPGGPAGGATGFGGSYMGNGYPPSGPGGPPGSGDASSGASYPPPGSHPYHPHHSPAPPPRVNAT